MVKKKPSTLRGEELAVSVTSTGAEQSDTNHQSREVLVDEDGDFMRGELLIMRSLHERSFREYRDLLAVGMPRELARTVLPVATYSEMYATIDLHNLLKFISERTADGAQYEIQVYAQSMLAMIKPLVPAAVAAWEAFNCRKKS